MPKDSSLYHKLRLCVKKYTPLWKSTQEQAMQTNRDASPSYFFAYPLYALLVSNASSTFSFSNLSEIHPSNPFYSKCWKRPQRLSTIFIIWNPVICALYSVSLFFSISISLVMTDEGMCRSSPCYSTYLHKDLAYSFTGKSLWFYLIVYPLGFSNHRPLMISYSLLSSCSTVPVICRNRMGSRWWFISFHFCLFFLSNQWPYLLVYGPVFFPLPIFLYSNTSGKRNTFVISWTIRWVHRLRRQRK